MPSATHRGVDVAPVTSVFPRKADIFGAGWHVSDVPIADSIGNQLATHNFTNLAQRRHQPGGDPSIPLGRQVNAVALQHPGPCRRYDQAGRIDDPDVTGAKLLTNAGDIGLVHRGRNAAIAVIQHEDTQNYDSRAFRHRVVDAREDLTGRFSADAGVDHARR